MLGISPKLRISDEERHWEDQGFVRLEILGRRRMLEEQKSSFLWQNTSQIITTRRHPGWKNCSSGCVDI